MISWKELARLIVAARNITDEMRLEAGGDKYTYIGSTNEVDHLAEMLDDLEMKHGDELYDEEGTNENR